MYIDTGAMYRSVGYYCLKNNIDLKNELAVSEALKNIDITMDNNNIIYLNGCDVSNEIRTDQVSMSASEVSKYQKVREFLVEQQRQMANVGGVILDGRDIGTVVLPNAELKIYQCASAETRAKRRYLENQQRGLVCDFEKIKKEIEERDYQDMNRKISPLKKADDAILLDTSNLNIDEVVEEVLKLVERTIKEE